MLKAVLVVVSRIGLQPEGVHKLVVGKAYILCEVTAIRDRRSSVGVKWSIETDTRLHWRY